MKGLVEANEANLLAKLELVDAVQRLGLRYLFDEEIKHALGMIHKRAVDSRFPSNLYATSLRFRLLRQHGFSVSQGASDLIMLIYLSLFISLETGPAELNYPIHLLNVLICSTLDVFKCFLDETGNFRESLHEDVEGFLSLYEASFHGVKGETIIDNAMEFSGTYLKAAGKDKLPKRLAMKVNHALHMPIHWRPNRLEARWFIDMYEEEPDMNLTLLKLAKLDYNLVQSTYMKEISKLARYIYTTNLHFRYHQMHIAAYRKVFCRWWADLGSSKMSFFRDRLLECHLWSVIIIHEPKHEAFRVMNTKIAYMTTMIDDVYDVYGLLEELELLTDFIDRSFFILITARTRTLDVPSKFHISLHVPSVQIIN